MISEECKKGNHCGCKIGSNVVIPGSAAICNCPCHQGVPANNLSGMSFLDKLIQRKREKAGFTEKGGIVIPHKNIIQP